MSSNEFYSATYQELWMRTLARIEREKVEQENILWLHADLKAHLANLAPVKDKPNGGFTAKDFMRSVQEDKPKKKLTLKEAKQSLGSKFFISEN